MGLRLGYKSFLLTDSALLRSVIRVTSNWTKVEHNLTSPTTNYVMLDDAPLWEWNGEFRNA